MAPIRSTRAQVAIAGTDRPDVSTATPISVTAPRAVRLLEVAGIVGIGVYLLITVGDSAYGTDDLVLHAGLMAIAVMIALARALRRHERRIWATLAGAIVVWVAGETYYLLAEPAGFSAADVCWLAAYPIFWAAFAQLIRARVRELTGQMWLDGVTCALAVAALAVTVVHYSGAANAAESATIETLAYPLMDVSLMAIAVAAAGAVGWLRDRTFLLLGAGFALLSIADLAWLVQISGDGFALGGVIDPGWPAALLLMSVAGWQPTRPVLPAHGLQRLVLPVSFAGASIGLLAVDHWTQNDTMAHPAAVALACGALVCVLARLVLTFRDKQRRLEAVQEEAVTDALTGLANRRLLFEDLERAATSGLPTRLVILDLNGFKAYNDTLGHPAGDALLQRFGEHLAAALRGVATPYRLGGDEFCLLGDARHGDRAIELTLAALSAVSDGHAVGAAWGASTLGEETAEPLHAMRLADQRMYEGKLSPRRPAQLRVHDAVLAELRDRLPDAEREGLDLADLARAVAAAVDVPHERRTAPHAAPREATASGPGPAGP